MQNENKGVNYILGHMNPLKTVYNDPKKMM